MARYSEGHKSATRARIVAAADRLMKARGIGAASVEAVMRDPFQGLRKPEPLRYVLAGCWSRRVSQEHRLVYRVTDEVIDFLQARYHY